MEQILIKAEDINLPRKMAEKLKGITFELLETKNGLILKPVNDPIKSTRGVLKGSIFTSERFMNLKKGEKELEP